MLIVVPAPGGDQDTSLRQTRKPMVIQALIPETPVEALDERILRGFPGLDQLELNAMLAGPLTQRLAGKFRSLVGSNGLGPRDPRHAPPGRGRLGRRRVRPIPRPSRCQRGVSGNMAARTRALGIPRECCGPLDGLRRPLANRRHRLTRRLRDHGDTRDPLLEDGLRHGLAAPIVQYVGATAAPGNFSRFRAFAYHVAETYP